MIGKDVVEANNWDGPGVKAISSRCKTFLPSFGWVIVVGGGGERVGHIAEGVDVVDVASVFVFRLSSRPIGLISV